MSLFRHRVFMLCITFLAAAGLARLGWWQLGRAAEKEALQTAITAQAAQPTLGNAELNANDGSTQLHQRVLLRGHWQAAVTVYLDNRPMSGRVGFIVVTPLRLEGRSEAIAVQRGWIPRDALDRTRLLPVATPDTLVEVDGRLAPEPSALLELQASAQGPSQIRQNLSLAAYSLEAGARLMPLTVLQQTPVEAPFVRDWPSPVVNVQKHYGYAFQWFAMCALVVGLYVWFQLIRPFRVRRG